jgi:hypothetical protein
LSDGLGMDGSPMGKRQKHDWKEKIQRCPPLGNQASCNTSNYTYCKYRSLCSDGQNIEPHGEERECDSRYDEHKPICDRLARLVPEHGTARII